MKEITTCLWFDTQAEEAAKFYTEIFPNSRIEKITKYQTETPSNLPIGSVMTVNFEINGMKFMGLNGGPIFKQSEAVSFIIPCKDQKEIDHYFEKLSHVKESEQCGWVKDKFGVSWQIVPENMSELVKTPQAMQAMLQMKKINISELEKANE